MTNKASWSSSSNMAANQAAGGRAERGEDGCADLTGVVCARGTCDRAALAQFLVAAIIVSGKPGAGMRSCLRRMSR